MIKISKLPFILLVIYVFSSAALFSSTLSTLKGYVKEKEAGNFIAKVKVKISSARTKTNVYDLSTNKKGYFYKTGLRNGVYRVLFEKEGYVPYGTTVRLRVGKTEELNIKLEVIKKSVTETDKVSQESVKLANQGIKMVQAGKYEEAIAKLSTAIEKSGDNFLLYYNRAIAFERKGDIQDAVNDYEKSLELKPDFLLSLSSVGKLYAKQNNFAKAIEFYKKAFDLGITDTTVLYNYAVCLLNLGKSNEALKVLEKLLSLDAQYADAYYHLGIIYLGNGDNTKAGEFLQKFIELDPKNANVPVAKEVLKTLK